MHCNLEKSSRSLLETSAYIVSHQLCTLPPSPRLVIRTSNRIAPGMVGLFTEQLTNCSGGDRPPDYHKAAWGVTSGTDCHCLPWTLTNWHSGSAAPAVFVAAVIRCVWPAVPAAPQLWDMRSKRSVQTLEAAAPVCAVTFSAAGDQVGPAGF